MRTSLAPRAPRPPMASLTCHICNVSLLLGPSGFGFGGVIAALRRRTLAPVLLTAHREEGAGLRSLRRRERYDITSAARSESLADFPGDRRHCQQLRRR